MKKNLLGLAAGLLVVASLTACSDAPAPEAPVAPKAPVEAVKQKAGAAAEKAGAAAGKAGEAAGKAGDAAKKAGEAAKGMGGEMGKKADVVEQYLHKGNQIFIEGHLKLDQWTSQEGQKRSMLKLVLDNMQFLEPRSDGGSPRGAAPPKRQEEGPPPQDYDTGGEPPMNAPPPGQDENIPF